MWRSIHSIIGLSFALLLMVVALSGSILSTETMLKANSPFIQQVDGLTLADGLKNLTAVYIEVEKLAQEPNGSFLLTHRAENRAYKIYVNMHDGKRLDKKRVSEFYAWMRGLHRSLFLERLGRAIVGISALVMSLLCISGTFLVIRRQGGVTAFFSKVRGHWSEKLHTIFSRLALVPLILLAVTGVYMALVTFHFIPAAKGPKYPESIKELTPVAAYELKAMAQIKLSEVLEVSYPIPGDWFDVYSVKTKTGYVFIDQFTGEIVSQPSHSLSQKIFDWIMFLHTAEGSLSLSIILGITGLSVPLFGITGIVVWARRQRTGAGRIKHNVAAHQAEMVILVGSEGGSTWGFAKNLHVNLTKSGIKTHINSMNKLRKYDHAKHIFIFTATYGDGAAPQNANRFLQRVTHLLTRSKHKELQHWSYSVLAFGDKAFPKYCAFAKQVDGLLARLERPKLIENIEVNKKSSQTFAHWGTLLVAKLAGEYEIKGAFDFSPPRPKTRQLILRRKIDYGVAVNAATSVFRFSNHKHKIGNHKSGDLVAIVPPNDSVARLYSIGSNSSDRYLEICVKKLEGGLCSGFLHDLQIGDSIDMYLIENSDFHLPKNGKPVTLIGAGTGIAPFIGMIKNNHKKAPISLYWGGRDPNSDFLYEDEIKQWLNDGRLREFCPAFSRVKDKQYVQDVVAKRAANIANDLNLGGAVMVCGGAAMAEAVRHVLNPSFKNNGTEIDLLKSRHLYMEDIY